MPYKNIEMRRQCSRESAKRIYHQRRSEYLKDKSCAVCGSKEKLELDHIEPATRPKDWSGIWSMKPERRVEELKKCQVLCRKHHWEKTRDENGWRIKHGTLTAYRHYRCRCETCRSFMSDYKKKQRSK